MRTLLRQAGNSRGGNGNTRRRGSSRRRARDVAATAFKAGWLWKSGRSHRTAEWKRRWFEWKEGKMYYYSAKPSDMSVEPIPLGLINMRASICYWVIPHRRLLILIQNERVWELLAEEAGIVENIAHAMEIMHQPRPPKAEVWKRDGWRRKRSPHG